MRLYSSIWLKRLALVAMKLTHSRHARAQDGERNLKWRLRPITAWEQCTMEKFRASEELVRNYLS